MDQREPVLHIVDVEKKFQNLIFINGKTSNYGTTSVDCLASVYTGFPSIIILDRETSFTSEEFRENSNNICIHWYG